MTLVRGEAAVLLNPDPDRVVAVGDIVIDVASVSVRLAGERVVLPLREFEVLLLLADNAGRVLSAASLSRHIWGPDFKDDAGNVKVHVNRLRRRLVAHLGQECIRTVRGLGYVLDTPAAPPPQRA